MAFRQDAFEHQMHVSLLDHLVGRIYRCVDPPLKPGVDSRDVFDHDALNQGVPQNLREAPPRLIGAALVVDLGLWGEPDVDAGGLAFA